MSQAPLRLVPEIASSEGPFPLERRDAVRRRLTNAVTALVVSRPGATHSHRIVPLETLDISESGLGAMGDQPLDPGAELRLFFPPHGGEPGFELRGWVVRCVPQHGRYRVGVTFGRCFAAA